MHNFSELSALGWGPFYSQQLATDELSDAFPCRVMAVHRGQFILFTGDREITLNLTRAMLQGQVDDQVTVGDWVMVSRTTEEFVRLLERKSLIKRKAAGHDNSQQLVAANIDTMFIVTSCNDDFNLSRLERYLAFAYAAEVDPVIVLTKQDTCDNPEDYIRKVGTLGSMVMVEAVNATDPATLTSLEGWCKPGQTIALLGSSGVGKSTLANALGADLQKTGDIREDDARGRHTTTHRSLLPLESGAVLLDSPGMRGLGLADSGEGISEAFEDVVALAAMCRFSDCQHDREPGCAVKGALEDQTLSLRRFNNFTKLMAEQKHHEATVAERRKSDKDMSKFHKKVKASKKSKQKS